MTTVLTAKALVTKNHYDKDRGVKNDPNLGDVIDGWAINISQCFFQVSRDVEKEKMGAIISRNKLKSMTKAREQEQQQLQV